MLMVMMLMVMMFTIMVLMLARMFGFARMLLVLLLVILAMHTVVILVMPLVLGLRARAHGEAALLTRSGHVDRTTRGSTASAQHEAVRGICHMFPGLDPSLSVGSSALEGSASGMIKVSTSDVSKDTSIAMADFMNITVGSLVLDNKQVTVWVTADLITWLHHAVLGFNPAATDLRAPFSTFSTDEGGNSS